MLTVQSPGCRRCDARRSCSYAGRARAGVGRSAEVTPRQAGAVGTRSVSLVRLLQRVRVGHIGTSRAFPELFGGSRLSSIHHTPQPSETATSDQWAGSSVAGGWAGGTVG
jgi:hypothetical protein